MAMAIRIAYPWMAKLVQRFTIFHAMSQSCKQNKVIVYPIILLLLQKFWNGQALIQLIKIVRTAKKFASWLI